MTARHSQSTTLFIVSLFYVIDRLVYKLCITETLLDFLRVCPFSTRDSSFTDLVFQAIVTQSSLMLWLSGELPLYMMQPNSLRTSNNT